MSALTPNATDAITYVSFAFEITAAPQFGCGAILVILGYLVHIDFYFSFHSEAFATQLLKDA
jgi:hypothetical protein